MAKKHTVLIALFVNSVFLIVLFSLAIQKNTKKDFPIAHAQESFESYPELPKITEPPTPLLDSLPDLPSLSPVREEDNKLAESTVSKPEPKVELAQAPVQEKYIELFVKRGDNLSNLAKKHGVTVRQIVKASHLTNTQLRIGQKLKIPKRAVPVTNQVSEEFYTIQKGDNLWLIASKYKAKVSDLMKLNDLDEHKAKRLQTGDKIRIH